MQEEVVLKVENLTKRFGGVVAVDNVNFALKKGESLGWDISDSRSNLERHASQKIRRLRTTMICQRKKTRQFQISRRRSKKHNLKTLLRRLAKNRRILNDD